jgi:hypothetical protein
MYAYNIAPNLLREDFGFMYWSSYDDALFESVLSDAEDQKRSFPHQIIGTEIDGRVIGMAQANIRAAGLSDYIQVVESDFKEYTPPEGPGYIVSNPPYGERIGENVDELYTAFGDNLKSRYSGWNAWFLSSNMDALKKVGLRPSRKIKLFNGSLECRMMKYEMYRGTKKIHKLEGRSGQPETEGSAVVVASDSYPMDEARVAPKEQDQKKAIDSNEEVSERRAPRRTREERGFQKRSFGPKATVQDDVVNNSSADRVINETSSSKLESQDVPKEESAPAPVRVKRGFQRRGAENIEDRPKSTPNEEKAPEKAIQNVSEQGPKRRSFSRNKSGILKTDTQNTETVPEAIKSETAAPEAESDAPKAPRKIRKFGSK